MRMQEHIDALMVAIGQGQPMHEIMRADEVKNGWTVIRPGEVSWLSISDWHPSIVVSQKGKSVRLVAILANNPNHGALRRTVAAIVSAGLTPIIVAPTLEMRATVKRWGWKEQIIGSGWDVEELWRPTKRQAKAEGQSHEAK